MSEANRDEVPLPEPHGYVGACNQYCIQPKDSPLMWEKLNRWTADQLREYGRRCVQAALESTAAELEAMRGALVVARDGYTSMQVTGLPCLPAYVERALGLIDAALTQGGK